MTVGTVIFDREFAFGDEDDNSDTAKKLLVILNDGRSGSYIVLKTTSRPRFKHRKHGCQSTDYYPNYYLPDGSCCLKGESWVLLGKFYEFDLNHFLQGKLSGRMSVIGTLSTDIMKKLLECAIYHEDIELAYEQILIDVLNSL